MSNASSEKSQFMEFSGSSTVSRAGSSELKLYPWDTFEDVLYGLHRDGILLHPHQLAEFFVMHGLPVDLRYVPDRLQYKAGLINEHYQGEMARLEAIEDYPWLSYSLV